MNFLLYSINCAIYSRNRENGGFVTTTSDSLRNSMHSSLLKSPFPSRIVKLFLLLLSNNSISDKSTAPSPFKSGTSVISIL